MTDPDNQNNNIPKESPVLLTNDTSRITFLEHYNISPVLFVFISLLIIFTTYQIIGGLLAFILFESKFDSENITGIRWITVFSQIVFLLLPTLLLTKLATFNIKSYLRFNYTTLWSLIFAIIGIFALGQMLQVYMVLQEQIPIPESIKPIADQLKQTIEDAYRTIASSSSTTELLFVVLVVAVVPAFAEEILFRGMIQRSIEKALTPVKGIILTGIIFGAFHLNPFTFVPLSLIGIYLGFLVVKSNSVFIPIGAHFFNNFIAVLAMYFKYDESELIIGHPDEISTSMMLLIFLFFSIIFFISIYYFIIVNNSYKLKNLNTGV